MRNTTFASLFLASATLASAGRLECLHTRGKELATLASCGDEASLNDCFSQLPLSTLTETLPQEIERCFQSAGCTSAESQIESFWVLRRCDNPPSDLRRGRRNPQDFDSSLAAAAKEPLVGARAALPIAAAITAMVRREATDTAAVTTTTARSSPSPCFSDSTSSYTTCPISNGKKQACTSTYAVSPVCIDGLICRSNKAGNPSCMYKESSLKIEGIIIAVAFATAIAISIVSICFLCCKERREHRRIERAAEAARIAKESKTQATVMAKRPGTAVTANPSSSVVEGQPLMYQAPSSPQAQQQQFSQQGQGYGGAPNPFADSHDAHPLR